MDVPCYLRATPTIGFSSVVDWTGLEWDMSFGDWGVKSSDDDYNTMGFYTVHILTSVDDARRAGLVSRGLWEHDSMIDRLSSQAWSPFMSLVWSPWLGHLWRVTSLVRRPIVVPPATRLFRFRPTTLGPLAFRQQGYGCLRGGSVGRAGQCRRGFDSPSQSGSRESAALLVGRDLQCALVTEV